MRLLTDTSAAPAVRANVDRHDTPAQGRRRTHSSSDPALPRPRVVPVRVSSPDSVARSGVAALLTGHPRLRLVAEEAEPPAEVVVHVERRVNTAGLRRLRDHRDDQAPRSSKPAPAMLVVTDGLADDDLLAALDAGVSGVLRRHEASRAQLISAVLAVADGAVLLPPRLQGLLVQHLRRIRAEVLDPNGLTLSGLTSRERDVLRLVAEGLDTEEIAARLAFSPRTVKYVLTHVMTRYGLRSRPHAVAYAVRVGAI